MGELTHHTVQLALNDASEYTGGRLCYFTEEKGVEVLERQAGDLTKHSRHVLHAVTQLKAGTRYSLFVVDESNGLGDKGLVQPDLSLTRDILAIISGDRASIKALARDGSTPELKKEAKAALLALDYSKPENKANRLNIMKALSSERTVFDIFSFRPLERVRLKALLELNLKPSDMWKAGITERHLRAAGITKDLLRAYKHKPRCGELIAGLHSAGS